MGDLVTSWVELDRLVGGCCLRGGTDRCSLFSLGKTSRLVQAAHNLARAAVTLMITGGAAPDRTDQLHARPALSPPPSPTPRPHSLLFDLQRLPTQRAAAAAAAVLSARHGTGKELKTRRREGQNKQTKKKEKPRWMHADQGEPWKIKKQTKRHQTVGQ